VVHLVRPVTFLQSVSLAQPVSQEPSAAQTCPTGHWVVAAHGWQVPAGPQCGRLGAVQSAEVPQPVAAAQQPWSQTESAPHSTVVVQESTPPVHWPGPTQARSWQTSPTLQSASVLQVELPSLQAARRVAQRPIAMNEARCTDCDMALPPMLPFGKRAHHLHAWTAGNRATGDLPAPAGDAEEACAPRCAAVCRPPHLGAELSWIERRSPKERTGIVRSPPPSG
jgi:hypothetical protein